MKQEKTTARIPQDGVVFCRVESFDQELEINYLSLHRIEILLHPLLFLIVTYGITKLGINRSNRTRLDIRKEGLSGSDGQNCLTPSGSAEILDEGQGMEKTLVIFAGVVYETTICQR